jgi:hypothetical protein
MHDVYEIRKSDIANGVSEMLMIWRISLSRQDLNFPSAIFGWQRTSLKRQTFRGFKRCNCTFTSIQIRTVIEIRI